MADVNLSQAGRPTPWLTTARRLLRNSRCSQSATPTSSEMADLHITLQQCESNQLYGLHNIGVVRKFTQNPRNRTDPRLAYSFYPYGPQDPVGYHSRYSSSLLVKYISILSGHAPEYVQKKTGRTRMKHDTYSRGTFLELYFAMPDANGSTSQYVAVVQRHRERPESFPTVVELYSILSLAAKFRKQQTHTGVVKVRLFVVYSCWVQVLSATAPLSYIMSILEGRKDIEGSLEISESPWFNLHSPSSLEQLLSYAFESVTLDEPEKIEEWFTKRLAEHQALKRDRGDSDGGVVKKQKVA